MLATPLPRLGRPARRVLAAAHGRVAAWTRPAPLAVAAGGRADAMRSKPALLLENALLRHQLLILRRTTERPRLTSADRGLLVLLANRLRTWAIALVVVRPETVLRWHRQGYRLFWRRASRTKSSAPRIPSETIELIRQMACENLCGPKSTSACSPCP